MELPNRGEAFVSSVSFCAMSSSVLSVSSAFLPFGKKRDVVQP